jgi:hypothetical protein
VTQELFTDNDMGRILRVERHELRGDVEMKDDPEIRPESV